MSNEKFEMHCIVELFGHSQIAGKVTEQAIGGASFIRVDVPKTSKRESFTKFYGAGAIYAITPVEESVAQTMAEALEAAPVAEWRLRSVDPARVLPAQASPRPGEDWDSSYEPLDDRFFDDEPVPDVPAIPDPAISANAVEQVLMEDQADDLEGWHEEEDDKQQASDKQLAAAWARELLKGAFVIFDTETTGIEADGEIIQIGIVDQTGAVILERLIKPTQPVPNSFYHGITDDMLVNAPGFPEVYGQIKVALEGKIVVAYNLDYDRRMLFQDCRRHSLDVIPFTGHCAMEQYAQFNGDWNAYHGSYRWKKLREALAAFRLKHEDFGTKAHDACTDARATLAVIQKMAEFKAEKSAATESPS